MKDSRGDLRSIVEKIKKVQQLMSPRIPTISAEITDIITTKNKDPKKIESLLDQLLNYSMMGIGRREFRKLNSYYKKVDPEAAEFYQKAYHEND